jgi:hypothetical protein
VKLRHSEISIPAHGAWLAARLAHAPGVRGCALVLQPISNPLIRQRELLFTGVLQHTGHASLALDLLTHDEELRDPDACYNVARLTERVLATAEWLSYQPTLATLPIGVIASGTASAAAIRAAVRAPGHFGALCLLGGRPDLAGVAPLKSMRVPTRLIVGKDDPRATILREVFELISPPRDWCAIDGAESEHLSAALLAVSAGQAADWLLAHLPAPPPDEIDPAPESK